MSDIFKEAAKRKIRFVSKKGNLCVEQLWGLGYDSLKELIQEAYAEKEKFKKLDNPEEEDLAFLVGKAPNGKGEAELADLKFEILKEVYKDKMSDDNNREISIRNSEKIRRLKDVLAKKEDEDIEKMSKEELEKAIKDLQDGK